MSAVRLQGSPSYSVTIISEVVVRSITPTIECYETLNEPSSVEESSSRTPTPPPRKIHFQACLKSKMKLLSKVKGAPQVKSMRRNKLKTFVVDKPVVKKNSILER